MKKIILFLSLLVIAVSLSASGPFMSVQNVELYSLNPEAVEEFTMAPLPASGEVLDILNLKGSALPRLGELKGAEVVFRFKEAQTLNRLAIPRIGYADWAVPSRVRVHINESDMGSFDLFSDLVTPEGEIGAVDVLNLGGALEVSEIRLQVEAVDSETANTHGILKLYAAKPAYVSVDLESAKPVPLDSSGIEFEVTASRQISEPVLTVKTYQFRRQRLTSITLPPMNEGINTVRVNWDSLKWDDRLPSPIEPYNFNHFTIKDLSGEADLELNDWQFVINQNTSMAAPWESVQARVYDLDDEGWQQGIPEEGFGRFGWMQNNGLLAGAFNERGFSNHIIDRKGNSWSHVWQIQCGEATYREWNRTDSDWVSTRHMAFYDFTSEVRNELAAKAPQLITQKRVPQVIQGSILAPGFLVDSEDTKLTLTLDAPSVGEGYGRIVYPSASGIVTERLGEGSVSPDMAEGWFMIVWSEAEMSPVLFVPKEKVSEVDFQGNSLKVTFEQPMGRVGLSFPGGLRPLDVEGISGNDRVLQSVRQIASIMRAYPISCKQRFREHETSVEIEERYNHLNWTNAWGESGLEIAPVSPLLSFAQEQNYPLDLPSDLEQLNWSTKYGPYAYLPGRLMQYSLSIPPLDTALYLAPQAKPDRLFPNLDAELSKLVSNDKNRLSFRDNLQGWWMWAPASLAFPLLDEAAKVSFLETWRSRLDKALQPHTLYLRHEPFSESTYLISFGWVEDRTMTIGDVNSGVGAALYSLWAYARCSGDWEFVQAKWPVVRGMVEYFLLEHDWCVMGSGAREHSASSAIDMCGIAYEGIVAYAQMAKELGFADESGFARFVAARLALSTTIRWVGLDWRQPEQSRDEWTDIGVGFSEFRGVDYHTINSSDADKIVSEIALSLSWVGQYPVLYDLHRWALGDDFWKWFQWDLVENRMVDWRTNHPGNRNNHAANVFAHLYFRLLLGESRQKLVEELEIQQAWASSPTERNGFNAMNPTGDTALENAGFYAMLEGMNFPLVLQSWGHAGIQIAEFNNEENTAKLGLKSSKEFTLSAQINREVTDVSVDGVVTEYSVNDGVLVVQVPSGQTRITVRF